MVEVEWGHGPHRERIKEDQVDALLDRIDAEARRRRRPEDVQVTVNDAGSSSGPGGVSSTTFRRISTRRTW
jgi:hypothetical protein